MKYIQIICSALLCIGYTASAVRREQSKVSRRCDILLAVCWGASALTYLLNLLS